MKRILLFLATNLAIVLVLSFTLRLLGVAPYLSASGINLGNASLHGHVGSPCGVPYCLAASLS